MKYKRIFLLVLDSLGVGEAKDASSYGDSGANTFQHVLEHCNLFVPNLKKIGLLDVLNMSELKDTEAYYTYAEPVNIGKDSLSGHYEMMGIQNTVPFRIFDRGFTYDVLSGIEEVTGRRVIGNKYCNDDTIIQELGDRQKSYGSLIIYSSADSDLQVAAHEDSVPISTLYECCERIRALTLGADWRIGRIIARPFHGTSGKYKFIHSARRDYAVKPPTKSVLDSLNDAGYSVIAIGKIHDIFDGQGINKTMKSSNNQESINKLTDIMDKNFVGLCMLNLSDFDIYGHNRDIEGYGKVVEELDVDLPIIINKLELDDLLIITADHGNDPTFPGTSHTRENVPIIIYSRNFKDPKMLPSFESLADIGATIADNFEVELPPFGKSILDRLV